MTDSLAFHHFIGLHPETRSHAASLTDTIEIEWKVHAGVADLGPSDGLGRGRLLHDGLRLQLLQCGNCAGGEGLVRGLSSRLKRQP